MPTAKNFFSQEQKERIRLAIMDAELNTSGEIRVHIEEVCEKDVMDRAAYVFGKLAMHKTKERNGVLFYLAFKNRKFAIVGDAGINAVVEPEFWNEAKRHMLVHFREDRCGHWSFDVFVYLFDDLQSNSSINFWIDVLG